MKYSPTRQTNHDIFSRTAAYCGLRVSLAATAALSASAFLGLLFFGYRSATPLYILLSCFMLPSLIHGAVYGNAPKKEEKESNLPFPLFRKKYKYEITKHRVTDISHLVIIIMFAAWHISYRGTDTPALLMKLPSVLAFLSLLIRLGVTIGYRIYFRFFPMKAMR